MMNRAWETLKGRLARPGPGRSKPRGASSRASRARVIRAPVPRRPAERARHYLAWIPAHMGVLLAAASTAVMGLVFWQFLFQTTYFEIDEWLIVGNGRVSAGEARAMASGVYEPGGELPLLTEFDVAAARDRLESHPAVFAARVQRVWPNTVAIVLHERETAALYLGASRAYAVDIEGVAFAEASTDEILDPSFAVLTAADLGDIGVGEVLPADFFETAMTYHAVIGNRRELSAVRRVFDEPSEYYWEGGSGLTLVLENGARLRCGHAAPSVTLPKAEALARKLGGLANVGAADLRLETHIPWRPRSLRPGAEAVARGG